MLGIILKKVKKESGDSEFIIKVAVDEDSQAVDE